MQAIDSSLPHPLEAVTHLVTQMHVHFLSLHHRHSH